MANNLKRLTVLMSLVEFDVPVAELAKRVNEIHWDDVSDSVVLDSLHLEKIMKRYLAGELSALEVEEWANLLESRNDITMSQPIRDVVYRLANPVLEGEISAFGAEQILLKLKHLSL